MDSRAVSWWSVHEFVVPFLDSVEPWPVAGTPAWCALDDDDPRKIAALFDAAQHHTLRVETCQQALAETSRDLSGAADWTATAIATRQRNEFLNEHPWARRRPA